MIKGAVPADIRSIKPPPFDFETPTERVMAFCIARAAANWILWEADFTARFGQVPLPVLRRSERFDAFCRDYRPLRKVKTEVRQQMRRFLDGSSEFACALEDCTGRGIETLAINLQRDFGLHGTPRSFVSKLAAFALPERFVAWDRFAKLGARRARAKKAVQSANYTSYPDYLEDVEALWGGCLGERVSGFIAEHPSLRTPGGEAFGRRVLDVYLMASGGRWSVELDTFPQSIETAEGY